MRWRLAGFALAIVALAFLIAWTAFTTRQEVVRMGYRFSSAQLANFEIADHLQATILRLNGTVADFALRRNPDDLEKFKRDSRELDAWIERQKPVLRSGSESYLLEQIDRAYDGYLGTVTNALASVPFAKNDEARLTTLQDVLTASVAMFELGYKLEDAHRVRLEGFLAESRKSLAFLQPLLFGSLVVLLGLGTWLALVVYRDLIAPLREQLIESTAIIERQEKLASLGMLAAGVAHEIRNPLTAIKARLFTQQKQLRRDSPAFADSEVIGSEINRLERIVRDFLQFARPAKPDFQLMPVERPLREVQVLLAPQLEKQQIQLIVEEVAPDQVRADPHQIKEVLINLVQNAAESIGQKGTITLRVRRDAKVLHDRTAEVVILEVADTGKGMEPEVQKRLFDPFFTTKETGTGLGLSIAARIVEKHGGALLYQTQVNRGTTFGIVLPRLPDDDRS